jgi:TolA-binding protein
LETAKDISSCPSCGSAVAAGLQQCSICGEDFLNPSLPERTISPLIQNTVKNCSRCGAPQSEGNVFCPKCGNEIAAVAKKPPVIQQKTKTPAQKSKTAKTASNISITLTPKLMWIALGICALIVVVVYLLRSTNERQASNQPTAPMGTTVDPMRLQEAKKAAEANPGDPQVLLTYANVLNDSKQFSDAAKYYEKYLSIIPDNPDARVDLGVCYFELKQFAPAIAEMERAVKDHPDHQLGHFNLGVVNIQAGNKEKAKDWFQKAVKLNPSSQTGQNAQKILSEAFN